MSRAKSAIRRGKMREFFKNLIVVGVVLGLLGGVISQFIGPYSGWANPYLGDLIKPETQLVERTDELQSPEIRNTLKEPEISDSEYNVDMTMLNFDKGKLGQHSTLIEDPKEKKKAVAPLVNKTEEPITVKLNPPPPTQVKKVVNNPVDNKVNEIKAKDKKQVVVAKEPVEKPIETVTTEQTEPVAEKKKQAVNVVAASNAPDFSASSGRNQRFDTPVITGTGAAKAELSKYDTNYRKSPKTLAPAIKHFYNWVGVQERRSKGRLVNKMWAVEYGDAVVLYMKMTDYFNSQRQDLRKTVALQFQKGWSDRLISHNRISAPEQAHVVLMNSSNKIIGGSREQNAVKIWAK